jgi:hypothetical protein
MTLKDAIVTILFFAMIFASLGLVATGVKFVAITFYDGITACQHQKQ